MQAGQKLQTYVTLAIYIYLPTNRQTLLATLVDVNKLFGSELYLYMYQ